MTGLDWIFLIFYMEVVFMVLFEKIIPFYAEKNQRWPKLTVLRVFAYNFQTPLWIFLFFVRKIFLCSSLRKAYSIRQENSVMMKFCPFKTTFWPFLTVSRVFGLWLLNGTINLPNFWKFFLWSSLRKSYSIRRKILLWRNHVHLKPLFGQVWQFREILAAYNFQTPP